jgi:hypothetical protein
LAARVATLTEALSLVEGEIRTYLVVDARLTPEYQMGWNDAVSRVADGLAEWVRAALSKRGD